MDDMITILYIHNRVLLQKSYEYRENGIGFRRCSYRRERNDIEVKVRGFVGR